MTIPFRSFLLRAWTCIAHPSQYKKFLKASFWSSFWYVYWVATAMLFITMLIALVGFIIALPAIREGVTIVQEDLPGLYPEALVVTLKDGEIATNMPEPYVVDFPPRWQEFLRGQDGLKIQGREPQAFPPHFIIFDTKARVEDYDMAKSLVLVTRTSIVLPDKDMSYRVVTADQIQQDFTMTKAVYDELVTVVSPFINAIPSLLVGVMIAGFFFLPFIGAAFVLLWYLLYLLVFVLLVWAIAALMSRNVGYGGLYKLSLNALTAPLLITFVGERAGLSYPYLFTLLALGWMIAVLRFLPKHTARLRDGNSGVKARKK